MYKILDNEKIKLNLIILLLIAAFSATSSNDENSNTCIGETCSSSSEEPLKRKPSKPSMSEKEIRELFSGSDITDWDWYGSTDKDRCNDLNEACQFWAEAGECENNPRYMLQNCQTSCNACISTEDVGEEQIYGNKVEETKSVIKFALQYFSTEVLLKPDYALVRSKCKNHHKTCSYWAATGECENNLAYMTEHCPLACRVCLRLDYRFRCPTDENMNNIEHDGGLYDLMNDISRVDGAVIHAKPINDDSPWVVELGNFLDTQDSTNLITFGESIGYDGTELWCYDQCNSNEIITKVLSKAANLTEMPQDNFEQFHLVKFDAEAVQPNRHDYHVSQVEKQYGPRIISMYLFLNDDGGKTIYVNGKEIIITAKTGSLLIWSNVLDENLNLKNEDIMVKGYHISPGAVEYGINIWLHNRNFRTAFANGCA